MFKNLLIFLTLSFTSIGQGNEYYIKLAPKESEKSFLPISIIANYHCPFQHEKMQQTFLIELTQNLTLEELKKAIGQSINYEYIESLPKDALFYTPNDLQTNQYALSIINAQQAWDLNLDASAVKIGIIDDAISTVHPDLVSSIWYNPNEIPNDGIDNDQNGFIDDISGWDFGNNDNDPNPISSAMYHGTHVAGIASASTNNGIGISAIGMNAKILPIKIGVDANGSLINGPLAIDYAISMGVEVINMSWGGPVYSQVYQDLFDIAYVENIVCIAAAGNSSTNLPMYPASYNYVVSVASTNALDQVSSFSNYGPSIDLAAPGSSIYSTMPAGQYGNLSGTSMAAPLVAGLVALMRDANPLSTNTEIESCLLSNCDPISGPLSNQIGSGRINAYESMLCITSPTAVFDSDVTQICPGNSVSFYNYSAWPGTTYSWSFPGGIPSTSNLQNPVVLYPAAGQYNVTLTVTNGMNNQSVTETNYVNVTEPSAAISGVSSIISGGYGSVTINMNGTPPFNLVISNGTTNYPVNGITSSPYVHLFNPTVDTDYSIIAFSDSQCNGTFSGIGTINVSTSTSQCDTANIAFIKYLGTNIDDMSRGLSDFGQYGYLVYGCKEFSNNNFRTYVCRLDRCGNVLWENIYAPNEYGLPVNAILEGNEIILLSYNGSSNTSVRTTLTRLDLNGNIISASQIGGPNNATYPRYMVEGQNGDLLIGSVTNSIPSIGGNDNYIVRAQPNGTIIWQKRLGTVNTEFVHNIFEDSQGDVLVTGYMIEGSTYSGFHTKLSANGNIIWSKKYNMGTGQTYLFDLVELNGFYYSVGSTNTGTYGSTDGILVKTDFNGNIVWSKRIGNTGQEINGCLSTVNDTVYIIGNSNSGIPNTDVVIYRFDEGGNMIDYGGFGTPQNDRIGSSGKYIQLNNQGDILGLASGNAGALGGYDITFFRFNSFLDICQPSTISLLSSNIGLQAITNPLTIQTPTWNFVPLTMTKSPVISNQGFECLINGSVPCSISANFSVNQATCFTDSISFIDLSGNNLSVSWNFGDNSVSGVVSSGSAISHLYASSGVYNVQLIVMDTLTGCIDSMTQQVNFTPNPSIDLIDTIFSCPGDTITINLIANCLSDQASVQWTPSNSIIGLSGNNPTVVFNQPGYMTVTITDHGVSFSDSVYIGISTNCCYSIPLIDQPPTVCLNDSIQFQHSSITNGAATYTWSFLPDGNPVVFTGNVPPLVTFSTPGIKYTILELNDSCGTKSDTLMFSLVEPPVYSIGNDTTFCTETNVLLGDTAVESWQYLWSPSGIVSDSVSPNPIATINTDQTISVTVTDTWTGCSFQDSIQFIMDSAFVDILTSDTSICSPELTVTAVHSNFNDLIWTPANVILQNNSNTVDIEVSNTLTLTAYAYSISGNCYVTDSITINLLEQPVPVSIDTTTCEGVAFNYYPTGVWLDGNQETTLISIANPGTYPFTEEHVCGLVQHLITLNNDLDCWCDVYVPNSFTPDGTEHNNTFLPVSDCIFDKYNLVIFNRWGEIVFESNDPLVEWDGTYNGKSVQDGSYIWRLVYSKELSDETIRLTGHINVLK